MATATAQRARELAWPHTLELPGATTRGMYDPLLDLLPFPLSRYRADRDAAVVFWLPSRRTWRRMLWSAGFARAEETGRFRMASNAGYSVRHAVFHAWK